MIKNLFYDSRKIQNPGGGLFFAIQTRRSDGHLYLKELAEAGISAAVVSKAPVGIEIEYILVDDTLGALQKLASFHRQQMDIPVIGITGSNGKTIVKEWISKICGEHFDVVKSPKSYNSQIGVALSLWQMEAKHTLGVFEAGISRPGEMDNLRAMIHPNIGVFTHLGAAHDANFSSDAQKLEEKLKLFSDCEIVIAPGDDASVASAIQSKNMTSFFWGRSDHCDLQIIKTQSTPEGTVLDLKVQGKAEQMTIPFRDQASINNCLSAISAALVLKLSFEKIQKAVNTLQAVDMRLQQVPGINGNTLILDHYNSDIESLGQALEFVNQQGADTNRCLILSDIPESPLSDEEISKRVVQYCKDFGIDIFIGIGTQFMAYRSLFETLDASFYTETEEFLNQYPIYTLTNHHILIKGARRFAFESISDHLSAKVHQTVLEVNMSRLQDNLRIHEEILPKGHKLMVMVKAFAYGVGGAQVAKLLEFNKVDYLGVAYMDEGIDLREAGIRTPIMVMNPDMTKASLMSEYNLEPAIFSFAQLKSLSDSLYADLKVHLEFNTGMNRLGFNVDDLDDLLTTLDKESRIQIASVFSHFAAADESEKDEFTLSQIDTFNRICSAVKSHFGDHILFHISNSPGIQRFEHRDHVLEHTNMARLGIGLYGLSSDPNLKPKLQNAVSFKSYIAQIRNVKAGEGIGYGLHDKSDIDRRVAVVAVGYADGYSRGFSRGVGKFLIKGKEAKILGNVCMDMCMCDVTDIDCKEGDEVIIFGDKPGIEDLANWIHTIPYEILSSVSQRVNRVFYQE